MLVCPGGTRMFRDDVKYYYFLEEALSRLKLDI
jgi:hypothetical protein